MCGRFSLLASPEEISEEFRLPIEEVSHLKPRYNVAPSQLVAVLIRNPDLKLQFFRWGLIPSWSSDASIGNNLINARSETIVEKPSFKTSFQKQRCLILADGFYEWKKNEKESYPYYIFLKNKKIFSFAGIWANWKAPDNKIIQSCTIITGQANTFMKPIHHRMPIIISQDLREEWLNPQNQNMDKLKSFLKPYPDDQMGAYPISNIVNSPKNDLKDCISPLSPP